MYIEVFNCNIFSKILFLNTTKRSAINITFYILTFMSNEDFFD